MLGDQEYNNYFRQSKTTDYLPTDKILFFCGTEAESRFFKKFHVVKEKKVGNRDAESSEKDQKSKLSQYL